MKILLQYVQLQIEIQGIFVMQSIENFGGISFYFLRWQVITVIQTLWRLDRYVDITQRSGMIYQKSQYRLALKTESTCFTYMFHPSCVRKAQLLCPSLYFNPLKGVCNFRRENCGKGNKSSFKILAAVVSNMLVHRM